ncbi:low molecular weight phosphatase family protein [Nafulsella turpanensis]|uniref:hypothetical protein n=1 Tax=Nafulsella turpanensis TaxID=1265690 RepID=UPI00034D4EA0|nr:hypothetical protein [Nafulsella turpanensis]
MLYDRIAQKAKQFTSTFGEIPSERKDLLQKLNHCLEGERKEDHPLKLVFICTHNSRRSHMAQLWAQVAAYYYQIQGVFTFSGGTEATAFNTRAVNAMREAGFKIQEVNGGENPLYEVSFADGAAPVHAYSKIYDSDPNPQEKFVAVMTCTEADQNCPFIPGAAIRFSLPYEDPKEFDGSPLEEEKYRERSEQIGREIFYVFSLFPQK